MLTMTKEIEVKILEVNREETEQILENLGAKKVFDGNIQTVFFDFSDGRITAAKNVLRLRSKVGKTELTFKKVSSYIDAKTAEEYSMDVSSIEAANKILENLGLVAVECMDKHRISYKLGDANFDFDRYLGEFAYVPEFLEIEADDIKKIYSFAQQFGYKPQDCLAWSTDELIKHYRNRKTVE
jgi:predicted adenylyl cyclase CyaB